MRNAVRDKGWGERSVKEDELVPGSVHACSAVEERFCYPAQTLRG